MVIGSESTESETMSGGVVMNFPVNDEETMSRAAEKAPPRRLRQRLLDLKNPPSAEEIESKLREADLRRKQFYELLSSKARPKMKCVSSLSSQEEELSKRLEAKLIAAEQNRSRILAESKKRLTRLDEKRQAAKSGVMMRFEEKRNETGMRLQSRVCRAESNRLLILRAFREIKATKREKAAQVLMQKQIQDSKYRECVHTAIHRKRISAERKRLCLLQAEKMRVHTRMLRVQQAAYSMSSEKENERKQIKDRLEDRLQKAKEQRADYLRQRRSTKKNLYADAKVMQEAQEHLSSVLARCSTHFVKTKKSALSLAKAYSVLEINQESIKSMPFQQLALKLNSVETINTTRALLDCLETRYIQSQGIGRLHCSSMENIDHLLNRVASASRDDTTSNEGRIKNLKLDGYLEETAEIPTNLPRYLERVVLCAYMIVGQPEAVFSVKGENELVLEKVSAVFIQEFEALIKIILFGISNISQGKTITTTALKQNSLKSQFENFDKAWCSYLHHFVTWKVEDVRVLEEDMVRAALQLEVSMMQTCHLSLDRGNRDLTQDMLGIQKQVEESQKILREKVQHLTGSSGLQRMDAALASIRSKPTEPRESFQSPDSNVPSPSVLSQPKDGSVSNDSSSCDEVGYLTSKGSELGEIFGSMSIKENELLVNEIIHEHHGFADSLDLVNSDKNTIQAKVKEIMEKAFWDAVVKSIEQNDPDFSWILKLMKEVRDELCEMSPQSWRQEIVETIDIDILSKVSSWEGLDMDYLQKIMEFSLGILRKLSAPAFDDEMRVTNQTLFIELEEITQAGDRSISSSAMVIVKGLRFILQQIQILKKEISKARIRILEPLIKGPEGVGYLKKAFATRYGPPSECLSSLPLTTRWLSSVSTNANQEWQEYLDFSSAVTNESCPGLPPTLRTGGSVHLTKINFPTSSHTGGEQPGCMGGRVDLLVRLGLLNLVSESEGLTLGAVPETLKLNFSRLRAVQSLFQKIIVISTSALVVRQTLVTDNLVGGSIRMEDILSKCIKRLDEVVSSDDDVGIREIVDVISSFVEDFESFPDSEKIQARKQLIGSIFAKSLQVSDAIFKHISRSVYLAARGAVLGGTGQKGKQLVEVTLKRMGVTQLSEKVMEAADILLAMATLSCSVHGAWYDKVLETV